jgi:hypothetical protein
MAVALPKPPYNVPMTDPITGRMTLEWQKFLTELLSRISANL